MAKITVTPYKAGTVTPYKAGTVNHATKNETAKITDTIYFTRDTVMESEAKKRAISC